MGKSTAADLLRKRGLPVVDSDVIARQIVEPGQPALAEVQRLFGADVVGADGRLRRDELARRVFTDPEARGRLEGILHPRIRAVWQAQFRSWRATGYPAAVAVIPLLFETDASRHFDATIGYGPSWAGLRPAKPILFLRALCASVTRPIRPHGTPVSSGSGQVRSRHDGR